MGLFSSAGISLVGLDISEGSVKLLELSGKSGKYRVLAHAAEPLPDGSIVDGNIEKLDIVGNAIDTVRTRSKTSNKHAAIAIQGSSSMSTVIQQPAELSEEDILEHLEFEGGKVLPFPPEETNMDVKILGRSPENEEENDVFLAAAKTEVVDTCISVVELGGFRCQVVDLRDLAREKGIDMIKEIVPQISSGTNAIIDIGSNQSFMTVVQNNQSVYARELSFGDKEILQTLVSSFQMNSIDAARAMVNHSFLPSASEEEIIGPFVESLAIQVTNAIEYFLNAGFGETLDSVYLGGPCASFSSIDNLLEQQLNINVERLNCFNNMSIAGKVNKAYLKDTAPMFLIASGLALRKG